MHTFLPSGFWLSPSPEIKFGSKSQVSLSVPIKTRGSVRKTTAYLCFHKVKKELSRGRNCFTQLFHRRKPIALLSACGRVLHTGGFPWTRPLRHPPAPICQGVTQWNKGSASLSEETRCQPACLCLPKGGMLAGWEWGAGTIAEAGAICPLFLALRRFPLPAVSLWFYVLPAWLFEML